MAGHPRLKHHLRPLRRGPHSVQLGMDPTVGIVLDGLEAAEVLLLEHLDGSRDLRAIHEAAAASGLAPERVDTLLATLRTHGMLVEAPTDRAVLTQLGEPWRDELQPHADALAVAYPAGGDGYTPLAARRAQRVAVSGEGGLPYAVADLLRRGGVGRVEVGSHAVDALDLELRHAPRADAPDLVVLTALDALHCDAGEPWRRRGIPHLSLVSQGHRVLVGPLVRPGPGPCLRCLDLHRRDRDAAWPALLAQLTPPVPVGRAEPVVAESTLTAVAAGVAAMLVHTYLDGQPVPAGVTTEVALPWPRLEHRRWTPHPGCHCAVSAGGMSERPGARVTMAG